MDSATQVSSNLFNDQGDICVDLTCRRCAYNLRGLREDGRCPECGIPIGRSTQGDFLRYSDPTWVVKLGRGVHLILWCTGLKIVTFIAAPALASSSSVPPEIWPLLTMAASLVSYWGAWLLTEPDPSQIGEDMYGTARRIVRISLGVGLLGRFLSIFTGLGLNGPLLLLVDIIMIACRLCGVAGAYCLLHYLSKIAQRIPDEKLEKRATFLKWPLTIGLLFFAIVPAAIGLLAAAGTTPGGGARAGVGCVSAVVGLCYLVFLLMCLRMLWAFRAAFRKRATFAEQLWSGKRKGDITHYPFRDTRT